MDDKKPVDEEAAVEGSQLGDKDAIEEPTSPDSMGWLFKGAFAVAAVVIIGILAFPLFNRQADETDGSSVPSSAQTTDEPAPTGSPPPTEEITAEGQFRLGNQFYEAGQLDEAVEAYQKAIELDPEYQGAYANLGVTYYQQQEFTLAASQYEKALELNSEDGEVAYNLGALYLQQALMESALPDVDLLDKSVTQLQKALEISPDLAEPHFTLGVAYFFLEEQEKAVEAFEAYLASGTDPKAQEEAERYLQELNSQ